MKGHGMLLSILASAKQLKELTNDAIISLNNLNSMPSDISKEEKNNLENRVFTDCSLVLLKIQQGSKTPKEVIKEALEVEEITEKAVEMAKSKEESESSFMSKGGDA